MLCTSPPRTRWSAVLGARYSLAEAGAVFILAPRGSACGSAHEASEAFFWPYQSGRRREAAKQQQQDAESHGERRPKREDLRKCVSCCAVEQRDNT
eukprot:scaffold803_cov310-Pinguiococcus_pyrenoidosus.AAC.25